MKIYEKDYTEMTKEEKKIYDKEWNSLKNLAKEQLIEKCYANNLYAEKTDAKIDLKNRLVRFYLEKEFK